MATLDPQDAYFHITTLPLHWQYLRSTIGNDYYEYKALSLGISTAFRVFTKIVGHSSTLKFRGNHDLHLYRQLTGWSWHYQDPHFSIRDHDLLTREFGVTNRSPQIPSHPCMWGEVHRGTNIFCHLQGIPSP